MPNGVVAGPALRPADRLVSRIVRKPDLAMTHLSAWTGIVYDEDDRRTQETVTQAQPTGGTLPTRGGTGEYAYDPLGRLVSARHPFEPDTTNYTLDDGGNIVQDGDTAFTFER